MSDISVVTINQGVKGDQGDQGDPGVGVADGGTTGQVLAKASDTDQDTAWVDPATGQVDQQDIDDAVAAEATLRANADTALQTDINSRALASALTSEASTRASADTANASAITTEATNRANADTALQTDINTRALSSALTTETTNRTNADTALQTDINTRALSSALTSEASTRGSADTALQAAIDLLKIEEITGSFEAPTAKTYTLDPYAAYAYQIETLKIKTASGTATVKLQIDGVDVTGISAVSVSSTIATGTATAARTVAVGAKVTMVVSGISTPVDMDFAVKITRTA